MKIETLAERYRVEIKHCGNGHWQIKGPLLVNYWPESKGRTAYVDGTTKGKKHIDWEEAIQFCFQAPEHSGRKDRRKGNSRQKRAALIRKGKNTCYWCNTPLTLDDSTLEHIIPLARGGLDNANNRALACKPCNHERGSDMPELIVNER